MIQKSTHKGEDSSFSLLLERFRIYLPSGSHLFTFISFFHLRFFPWSTASNTCTFAFVFLCISGNLCGLCFWHRNPIKHLLGFCWNWLGSRTLFGYLTMNYSIIICFNLYFIFCGPLPPSPFFLRSGFVSFLCFSCSITFLA